MKDSLEIFVIYKHPRDYPNGYVVRRSVIGGDRKCETCASGQPHVNTRCANADVVAQYADSLGGARALIPMGKIGMPRQPDDDPAIAEVWL